MAEKQRAPQNRTLSLTNEQEQQILRRCLDWRDGISLSDLMDGVLMGDAFELMEKLPDHFVDLLIVDDDTLILSEDLLEGFDEEMNEFLKKLLEE